MKKFLWIGLGMLVAFGLVAGGALTARAVLAQSGSDAAPVFSEWMHGRGGRGPMTGGEEGPLHDYLAQALAEKLGLTVDEVNAALAAGTNPHQLALDNGVAEADIPALLQEVHSTALAAAVADGAITQEQADLMSQRMQNRGERGGMMGGEEGPLHDYAVDAFAARLGLTPEAVEAAHDAGTSMYQLAIDNGVAEADVPALLQEVHTTALAAAVADGAITQEQADLMSQHMLERGFNGGPMGGMRGTHGGMTGGRGFRGNNP